MTTPRNTLAAALLLCSGGASAVPITEVTSTEVNERGNYCEDISYSYLYRYSWMWSADAANDKVSLDCRQGCSVAVGMRDDMGTIPPSSVLAYNIGGTTVGEVRRAFNQRLGTSGKGCLDSYSYWSASDIRFVYRVPSKGTGWVFIPGATGSTVSPPLNTSCTTDTVLNLSFGTLISTNVDGARRSSALKTQCSGAVTGKYSITAGDGGGLIGTGLKGVNVVLDIDGAPLTTSGVKIPLSKGVNTHMLGATLRGSPSMEGAFNLSVPVLFEFY